MVKKSYYSYPIYLALILYLFINGCKSEEQTIPKAKKANLNLTLVKIENNQKQKLSEYKFFKGKIADLDPTDSVFPYTLNTPLFSDYAYKKRFIFLPKEKKMSYNDNAVFNFEEGTILIKNFYYPKDFRAPEGEKNLIETRLLIREKEKWTPLNYIWNEAQDEAFLNYVGTQTKVNWIDSQGISKKLTYSVPNNNQCKNCHLNGKEVTPIGPTAAQLNGKYKALSETLTQLQFFTQNNRIREYPQNEIIPRFSVWNDPSTGSVEERAKAYLDINCAHCHQPQGSAKNSGLDLRFSQTNLRKKGVFKPPVAAGKGSGDRLYSIVPGHPERSILLYRMENTNPGVRMPEIGRSIAHTEGIALISEYIKTLTFELSDH